MHGEKEIANELKNKCMTNGEEINPRESAKLLHKLGLVYKEKSPDKISLIQSVALMTSAIIREPDNVEEIKKDLTDLCLHILTLANASKLDISLVDDAVAEAKQAIKVFRETTKQKLESLKPIRDELKGDQLIAERNRRVEFMSKLQDYVTKQYTEVMQLIARHTTTIMGKPPCKFALVGMGSLARKEITPYSDFENIIVLEEGVQHLQNFENSLKYFRWFATVFQMILVRLGETILKFLVIPCLNDQFNKENNWFFDKYTPCGICPDGFAPQASKNPLGRQTKTKKKPWITELIKPVNEMVKYLDTEEDLKEGYHLGDMLTHTCFVYGAYELHTLFKRQVEKRLDSRILGEEKKQQIKEDLQPFPVLKVSVEYEYIDIKRFLYRSSSLFIQALGTLHGSFFSNSFDIVDDLLSRDIIDSATHEEYQFSLAIACEMRLRTYSNASAQDDFRYNSHWANTQSCIQDLARHIGNRAVVDCLTIAAVLQEQINKLLQIDQSRPHNIYLTPIFAAIYVGLFNFAVQLIEEAISLPEVEKTFYKVMLLPYLMTSLNSCGQFKLCVRLVKKCLPAIRKSPHQDLAYVLMYSGGQALLSLKKSRQALKLYRKANFYAYANPTDGAVHLQVNIKFARCFFELGRYTKALKYYKRVDDILTNSKNKKNLPAIDPEFFQTYAGCLRGLDRHKESEDISNKVLMERQKLHVDEESDPSTLIALTSLGDSFYKQMKYDKALSCYEKALKHRFLNEFLLKKGEFPLFIRKTRCLVRLQKVHEASQWANDNFNIKYFTSLDKINIQDVITTLLDLVDIMKERRSFFRAWRHFNQAEQLLPLAERCIGKLRNGGSKFKAREPVHQHVMSNQYDFYARFVEFLSELEQFAESVKYAKKGFHIVFCGEWLAKIIEKTDAAFNLVVSLSNCHRYRECLDAAKHAITLYKFAYDDCYFNREFCEIVKRHIKSESQLGINSVLPYKCTPSIFFNADK